MALHSGEGGMGDFQSMFVYCFSLFFCMYFLPCVV